MIGGWNLKTNILKQSREDMSYKTTVIASWVMIVGLGVTVEKAGMSRI